MTWQSQRAQISGQRARARGTGGNKDQLWFSLDKKTSCTGANSGVRRKNKLYGGYNT